MSAPSPFFSRLLDLLVDSFDPDSLEHLVRVELDTRLHNIANTKSAFLHVAFQAASWAEQEKRLLELVAAAAKAKPQRAEWAQLTLDMVRALRGETAPPETPPPAAPQPTSPPQRPEPGPVLCPDDPQKGRWGGLAAHNGRELLAVLDDYNKSVFFVNLIVRSTDGSLLQKPVVFHLHDTYPQPVIHINRIRGGSWATLEEVQAAGVYTVGVQVLDRDNRWIGLELDLAKLRGLPKRFR